MSNNIPNAENHLHPDQPKWFAVYCRSKSEKVVQKLLANKGIESYLPLQKVTRRYTRKIKTYEIPLITCYVFVRITKGEYVPVLETENIVRFVKIARNLISIPDEEIQLLQRIVGEGEEVEAEAGVFKEGDKVEVIGGKLTGLRGKLIEQAGKKQMVVALDTVGYSLKMNIDVSLLRRI